MTLTGEIRPLNMRRDLDQLGELIQTAFAGELDRRGSDLREELRSVRRLLPLVRLLGRLSGMYRHVLDGFVCEDQGRLVASVMIQQMGRDRTRWYISAVATHPDYRRRGLARHLVTRAIVHARANGAEICALDVRSDNPAAYSLYRDMGFVHYDSTTELKAENPPLILHPKEAEGYTLRPMKMSEWEPRYALARRETPPEVSAFMPVSKNQFRVSLLDRLFLPLLRRLQGLDQAFRAAERDAQVVGVLRLNANRVARSPHELRLSIDPGQRAVLAEPLLTLGLRMLQTYPRQNTLTTVRTADVDLLDLLRGYGFLEIETLHRLGLRL